MHRISVHSLLQVQVPQHAQWLNYWLTSNALCEVVQIFQVLLYSVRFSSTWMDINHIMESATNYCLCLFPRCATVLNSFGSVCRDCVVLHVATGPGICVESPASRFETNYGLMILSRKELKNTNASGYNPLSQFRGYLEASVSLALILSSFLYIQLSFIIPHY